MLVKTWIFWIKHRNESKIRINDVGNVSSRWPADIRPVDTRRVSMVTADTIRLIKLFDPEGAELKQVQRLIGSYLNISLHILSSCSQFCSWIWSDNIIWINWTFYCSKMDNYSLYLINLNVDHLNSWLQFHHIYVFLIIYSELTQSSS